MQVVLSAVAAVWTLATEPIQFPNNRVYIASISGRFGLAKIGLKTCCIVGHRLFHLYIFYLTGYGKLYWSSTQID